MNASPGTALRDAGPRVTITPRDWPAFQKISENLAARTGRSVKRRPSADDDSRSASTRRWSFRYGHAFEHAANDQPQRFKPVPRAEWAQNASARDGPAQTVQFCLVHFQTLNVEQTLHPMSRGLYARAWVPRATFLVLCHGKILGLMEQGASGTPRFSRDKALGRQRPIRHRDGSRCELDNRGSR